LQLFFYSPITPGKPITFELGGKFTEVVAGGTFDLAVQIGGVPIFTKKGNLCDFVSVANARSLNLTVSLSLAFRKKKSIRR
jgi:hypothetical protein